MLCLNDLLSFFNVECGRLKTKRLFSGRPSRSMKSDLLKLSALLRLILAAMESPAMPRYGL